MGFIKFLGQKGAGRLGLASGLGLGLLGLAILGAFMVQGPLGDEDLLELLKS